MKLLKDNVLVILLVVLGFAPATHALEEALGNPSTAVSDLRIRLSGYWKRRCSCGNRSRRCLANH